MGNEHIITRRRGRIGSEAAAAAASTLPATSSALDAAVARAIAEATSANTRRAYRAQAGVFAEWCAANRVGALPASPETAARYLTARGTAGAKVATIHAARSAISALHRAAGVANPVESELVRATVRGLSRQHRAPQRQAAPLSVDGLAAILATAHLPRPRGRGMESESVARARGAVDAAIAGLLFQAGLRRSEAADLEWQDVEAASTPVAYRIRVRAGKTNQTGSRVDVRFVKNGAARALADLRTADAQPSDKVFVGLNGASIGRRLAAAAAAAGLEGDYSGHSGRVGLASELTTRGASLQEVMLAGGWRGAGMVARYSAGAVAEAGAVNKYL